MIKYFHYLSREEYSDLVKKKMTYGELAKEYWVEMYKWIFKE